MWFVATRHRDNGAESNNRQLEALREVWTGGGGGGGGGVGGDVEFPLPRKATPHLFKKKITMKENKRIDHQNKADVLDLSST